MDHFYTPNIITSVLVYHFFFRGVGRFPSVVHGRSKCFNFVLCHFVEHLTGSILEETLERRFKVPLVMNYKDDKSKSFGFICKASG